MKDKGRREREKIYIYIYSTGKPPYFGTVAAKSFNSVSVGNTV